jgi:hypothetical protein
VKQLTLVLIALATPAFAQMTPAKPSDAPNAVNGIPNTQLSTSTDPSNGPRSKEADLPSNTTNPAAAGAAAPAPAPLDHYPICKRGEFDHCMEPGNHPARHKR